MLKIKQKILEPSKIYVNSGFKLKIKLIYTRRVKELNKITVREFNSLSVIELVKQPKKYNLEEVNSMTLLEFTSLNLENMKGVN